MKHLVVFVLALVCFAFAGLVLWSNRTALTTSHLLFSGGMATLAVLLAGGADAKAALSSLAGFAPVLRGGKPE